MFFLNYQIYLKFNFDVPLIIECNVINDSWVKTGDW